MTDRPPSHPRSFPIDKIVVFVAIGFFASCVIYAVKRQGVGLDGDAAALPASHVENGMPPAADTAGKGDGIEDPLVGPSGWPRVDRDRLRSGVVQDIADAFALGKYSGLVTLSTETEQRLFDDWCERAAAWTEPWNRDPILYADGTDQSGARVYRVELHGKELGRLHVTRYANGWNVVGVEERVTRADLLAEERILREAAARAGVVRDQSESRASTSSNHTSKEREKRER